MPFCGVGYRWPFALGLTFKMVARCLIEWHRLGIWLHHRTLRPKTLQFRQRFQRQGGAECSKIGVDEISCGVHPMAQQGNQLANR